MTSGEKIRATLACEMNQEFGTVYCPECDGEGELDGEDHGNYHDCPEGCTEAGKDDCTGCKGKGYIAPPVKCGICDGEGDEC